MFAVYALLSAVPVVALGLVLDRTYRAEAEQQGVQQGLSQAAVIEEMAISPALSGTDLSEGLSSAERRQLSDATDLAVYKGSVLRLRLRDFDGRVVFSDDGRTDSDVAAGSWAFQEAAVGRTSAEVVGTGDGRRVRVLRPVVAHASGRSTGVLELDLPYDGIAAAVDATVRRAWNRLLIGLVLLYAVLAAVSWSTSRSLRRHADQREHEALHDALTGLPNRALFAERAQQACDEATAESPAALVLIDLDRFKDVNDTLGHHAGDMLLREVARRLAGALRTDDVAARLGGDEFGLVLPRVAGTEAAVALLDEVRARLADEVVVDGVVLSIEASVGVALAPVHGTDVETLLKRADAAMYRGKAGSRSVVVADTGDAGACSPSVAVLAELRHALERDELVLHYQPKVDLRTGQTVGVEALARWQHPVKGLLGPAAFLPVVEQSDVVAPFTRWVLTRALQDLTAWRAAGRGWAVSVNVSVRNLEQPGFADEVTALLDRFGVPGQLLTVEITETALAADATALCLAVEQLAAAGVQVSVDDFGTGWSSLAQLRALPVAEVKLDRSFVHDLDTSPQDRILVASVLDLAHGLGCRVVAEGVETAGTAEWLRDAGCDEGQGWHWQRPAPWPELPAAPALLPSPRPSAVLTERTPA